LTKSKGNRENLGRPEPPPRAPEAAPFPSPHVTRLAVIGGLAALVVLASLIWQQSRRIERILDSRLGQLDDRLDKVAKGMGPAAAPQRGPDPNRVYTVKTDGAPARGPASAPVTIAEFSDFQ
jgi:protein-disulfide isomerase